jgi:hypothetical protein
MFLMRMTTSPVSQKMLIGWGSKRHHTRDTLQGRQILM